MDSTIGAMISVAELQLSIDLSKNEAELHKLEGEARINPSKRNDQKIQELQGIVSDINYLLKRKTINISFLKKVIFAADYYVFKKRMFKIFPNKENIIAPDVPNNEKVLEELNKRAKIIARIDPYRNKENNTL